MASRSVQIHFQNNTNNQLTLMTNVNKALSHGIWSQNDQPPATISPGTTVQFGSESSGFATGTTGALQYQIDGTHVTVIIMWNNPYAGSNEYGILIFPPSSTFTGSHSGGSEDNANVTYVLNG